MMAATASIFVLFSFGGAARAEQAGAEASRAVGPMMRVGGFKAADVNAPDVQAAATFAVARLGNGPDPLLGKINSARTQVVAGRNYLLDITLADGSRWTAKVFLGLGHAMRLTEAVPAAAGPPRTGGWSLAAVDDNVRAVAAFAVPSLGRPDAALKSIDVARRQVVAGMNYSLDLVLTDGSVWRAQIFRGLDGKMKFIQARELSKT
jgi:hypothetical protein